MERPLKVIELRKQGLTLAMIGYELGISRQSVHEHLRKALAELAATTHDMTAGLREIEVGKLDMVEEALMPKMLQGDVEAVSAGIRLMARRAKLLCLDTAHDGKGGMVINVIDPNNYTPDALPTDK